MINTIHGAITATNPRITNSPIHPPARRRLGPGEDDEWRERTQQTEPTDDDGAGGSHRTGGTDRELLLRCEGHRMVRYLPQRRLRARPPDEQ